MQYKFNSYNEDYIMINRNAILTECYQLNSKTKVTEEEIEILQILSNLHNKLCTFKYNNINTVIIDIAIEKNSKIGQYILANQSKQQYITMEEIIHALLICINRNDWQYYSELANLIKTYGQITQNEKRKFSISYEEIKLTIGEEIANYIINSKSYSTKTFQFDKNVYVYKHNEIIKTILPEPITKPKIKTREKNK